MTAPLSPEKLNEIKAVSDEYRQFDYTVHAQILAKQVPALVAEVERLRAALAIYAAPFNWGAVADFGLEGSHYFSSVGYVDTLPPEKRPWQPARRALTGEA